MFLLQHIIMRETDVLKVFLASASWQSISRQTVKVSCLLVEKVSRTIKQHSSEWLQSKQQESTFASARGGPKGELDTRFCKRYKHLPQKIYSYCNTQLREKLMF